MSSLISIIIPTYNSALHIERCLESILIQDQALLELIIIDGCSNDSTLEIIRKYNFSNIIILSEPDSGIYHAMNKGIKLASGCWLIFMGSDDYFYNSKVFTNFKNFLNSPTYLQGSELIFGDGLVANRPIKNSMNWRMIKNNSINHQCIFYSRSIFELCTYDTSYKIAADYKMNLQLYLLGTKYSYFPHIISVYNDGGISSRSFDSAFKENCRVRLEVLGENIGAIVNFIVIFIKPYYNKFFS